MQFLQVEADSANSAILVLGSKKRVCVQGSAMIFNVTWNYTTATNSINDHHGSVSLWSTVYKSLPEKNKHEDHNLLLLPFNIHC